MYAGPAAACRVAEPVLAGLSDRRRRVGDRPGMAQALKLANNFLSATALAATSEAIAFGLSVGLDMATMLEVIDAVERAERGHPGQVPAARADRSLRRRIRQLADGQGLQLYLGAVEAQGAPSALGLVTESVWARFATESRGSTSPGSTPSWPDEGREGAVVA